MHAFLVAIVMDVETVNDTMVTAFKKGNVDVLRDALLLEDSYFVPHYARINTLIHSGEIH